MNLRRLSLAALAASFASAALAAPTKYDIKTLAPLSGDAQSFAFGINDSGWVVGTSNPGGSAGSRDGRGVVWNGTNVVEIGAPGGYNAAVDISNSGYVATWNNTTTSQAGRYNVNTGTFELLEGAVVANVGATTMVTGVSEDGTVLGQYTPERPKDSGKAVAWRGGSTSIENLYTQGGGSQSEPSAIAPNGDVFGHDDRSGDFTNDSWLYRDGDFRTNFARSPGAFYSSVTAANDSGQAVGFQSVSTGNGGYAFQPMLWDYTGIGDGANPETALGTPLMGLVDYPSNTPTAINDSGLIVGTVDGSKWGAFQGYTGFLNAFVLSPENGRYAYYDLNGLIGSTNSQGFLLIGANDVNNLGQIVGYGYTSDGEYRAFIATPQAVPEPASLAALAFGVTLVMRRRLRS